MPVTGTHQPLSVERLGEFRPIFLQLPPENIALLKSLLESYDELGIVRTLDRKAGEVVILSLDCAGTDLDQLLHSLKPELNLVFRDVPPECNEDWLVASIEAE